MIKALIFDMDGVIIDSEPFWEQAETEIFATVGINITPITYLETAGTREDETVQFRFHQKPWTNKTPEQVLSEIIHRVIELVNESGIIKPGVRETLQLAKELNLKIGLASSSYESIIEAVLIKTGIREFFDVVYSAEHEEYGKPHPGVYISTAKLLGVSPFDCVAIEDTLNGVIAAKSAKMRCICVPGEAQKDSPKLQIADLVLDNLSKINKSDLM